MIFSVRSFQILARLLLASFVLVSAVLAVPQMGVKAATLTVSNTNDSGPGSLRQAILDANANSGADTINFTVDGTISLTSSNGLAMQITDSLTIDGSGHQVVVDGLNASPILWSIGASSNQLTLNLYNLTLANGNAGAGGALASSYTDININKVTFNHNFAYSGGAISFFFGTLNVANSTFSGNGTNNNGGLGNTGPGGAIFVGDNATNTPSNSHVVISNSTFTGSYSGDAGSVLASQNGDVTIINSTLAGNNTQDTNPTPIPSNGALYNYNFTYSVIRLKNTILANNTGGNCGNTITDDGGNLIDTAEADCPSTFTIGDAKLGALADNGGPTLTMLPGSDSAAIDTGLDSVCAANPVNNLDQRGVSRPQGVHCDVGAVEVEPSLFNFNGFFQPVDNPGPGPEYVFNSVKAGSGIPVKFSLNGDQGLSIFAVGYPASQQVSCTSASTVDAIEQTVTAGSSSLSYDATSDQYTYVWKTNSAWKNTCRVLTVRLSDGADHLAYFKFK